MSWADAFCFGAVRTFGGSASVVVFAFVDACEHPAVVLVDAAAGQRDRLALVRFVNWLLGFSHA